MELTTEIVIRFLERAAERIAAARDELTHLDAMIGDADHGANLDRGFTAVVARLRERDGDSIGAILRSSGATLVSTVGGSSGPLYGTALIRAGAAFGERNSATPAELLTALEAGLEGVMARGKAHPGEKTMIDTLAPAIAALRAGLEEGLPFTEALRRMVAAAEQGMHATVPMLALKGRASYLGERSIGHQDPGATSAYYLLLALLEAVEEARP